MCVCVCVCDCVCVCGGVIAWVRECVGITALIAASKYVHVCVSREGGRGEGECV